MTTLFASGEDSVAQIQQVVYHQNPIGEFQLLHLGAEALVTE